VYSGKLILQIEGLYDVLNASGQTRRERLKEQGKVVVSFLPLHGRYLSYLPW